jgi:hypothetical protein
MPIVENGVNFPAVLGRRNVPAERPWPAGGILANLPAVRGLGREPSLLPEVPVIARVRSLLGRVGAGLPAARRAGLIGTLGIIRPQYEWPPERPIGEIPKPMSIISGPVHPLHPEVSVEW